ncbi:MAG TPA: DUF2721 domain-containing protein [Rhabdochlamydiaceae bacterium]|nr:DUF2721 domain-containing protein [Rhabdochlamydiaceae bacterium]
MLFALISMLIVSSILCFTFYNRIVHIMERLKVLQKERRSEYKELFRFITERKPAVVTQEEEHYLRLLERQTALVMKRAKLIQHSLFCFIVAMCSLIFSLFCSFVNRGAWELATLGFFIFGLLLIFSGFVFVLLELKMMLNPIRQESEFVQKLIKDEMLRDNR